VTSHHAGPAAVNVLDEIVMLSDGTAAHGRVRVDPSLARGLSYYTGAIMEVAVPDLAGSLGGGGRYDNLVGMFLGRDVPACGFSLGLERIIVVMTERNMFPAAVSQGPVDLMVTIWNDDSRAEALALASELRGGGLRVEVYPEADKLGRQFKYAAGRNVRFVAVVGDDERAHGTVTVKDMRSGDQVSMPRAGAAAFVAGALNA
jgi:histidyl-tRNA synthetase